MSKPTRRRRRRIARDGTIIGLVGALSAVVIDSVLHQTALSGSPILMAGARVATGFGVALVADKIDASDDIVNGIVAGPAFVTAIDLSTRLIGTRRVDPPPAAGLADAGDAWAPRLT